MSYDFSMYLPSIQILMEQNMLENVIILVVGNFDLEEYILRLTTW